jgi:hypothetical protein
MVLLELQGLIERTLKHRANLIYNLFALFKREKIINQAAFIMYLHD